MSHRLAGRTGWKRLKPTDADFDCRHSHPMAGTRSAHCRLRRGVRGIRERGPGREAPFDNPWHWCLESTALTAAIGKAEAFEHGRDLSAWLGLVPRQATTGGRPKLFGISKRGNKYIRPLLIHGARAAL